MTVLSDLFMENRVDERTSLKASVCVFVREVHGLSERPHLYAPRVISCYSNPCSQQLQQRDGGQELLFSHVICQPMFCQNLKNESLGIKQSVCALGTFKGKCMSQSVSALCLHLETSCNSFLDNNMFVPAGEQR